MKFGAVVRSRWFFVCVVAAIFALVAGIRAIVVEPSYEGTSTITPLVPANAPQIAKVMGVSLGLGLSTSDVVLERAAADAGVQDSVATIRQNVTVTRDMAGMGLTWRIVVRATSASGAERLANAIAVETVTRARELTHDRPGAVELVVLQKATSATRIDPIPARDVPLGALTGALLGIAAVTVRDAVRKQRQA